MSRKIVEKTVVISALPIFDALELNLTRLMSFSVIDFFAGVGNIVGIDRVENIEL